MWGDEIGTLEHDHWWYAGRRAVILAALRRYVPAGARVLDFGCGGGALTQAMAGRYRVLGVDTSPTAIQLAQGRGIEARLIASDQDLPSGFDAVCALDVIEHLDDDVAELRRMAAAVRRGGMVVVTVPAYRFLWGQMDGVAGHRRRYRLRGLGQAMREAGLSRVHASYFNMWLFPLIAVGRLVGLPRREHEVDLPPRLVNAALRVVFETEAPLASRFRLPFGVSILYVARVN